MCAFAKLGATWQYGSGMGCELHFFVLPPLLDYRAKNSTFNQVKPLDRVESEHEATRCHATWYYFVSCIRVEMDIYVRWFVKDRQIFLQGFLRRFC